MKSLTVRERASLIRRHVTTLVAGLAALLSLPAMAAGTATLNVEVEAFDLDGGAIHGDELLGVADAASGADIRLSYHADRAPHAVLVPAGEGIEMAVVANTSCDSVTPTEAESAAFSLQSSDISFASNHCILVRTDQGAVFKLGNVIETGMTVTFDFTAL